MTDDHEPKSNVIPFHAPRMADVTVGLSDDVPAHDIFTISGEVTFDSLITVAKLLMKRAINDNDWSVYLPAAKLMLDESDANAVIRLMKNAEIEVYIGGE